MQQSKSYKPQILNLDVSPKYLPDNHSFFLLNNDVSINPNGGTNGGASLGKSTPMAANYLACDIDKPEGENFCVGKYRSELTNELYSWHYNSNGVHWIQRIKGDGTCEIVYFGDCLELSADPKNEITQFRSYLEIEKICKNRHGKYLIWTDGKNPIGYIDVEASIATNNFTTPFFNICPDPCAYIQLCVPEICGCITAEYLPLTPDEYNLTNFIAEKSLMFSVQHIYYDGRHNEWSGFSTLYYQNRSCFFGNVGASRCIKLKVPIGNPMVDKIKIAYSEDGGVNWYEYDTIEKYKQYNTSQQKWYEREFSEIVSDTIDTESCTIDYVFCGDKNKKSISPDDISRVRNPIPRTPQALLPIGEALGYVNYVDGVCPVNEDEISKFDIEKDCSDLECPIEYAEVKVRAVILTSPRGYFPNDTPISSQTGFIYRLNGEINEQDDISDTAIYGGTIIEFFDPFIGLVDRYNNTFKGSVRGFVVYVDGTEYWAETKQWKTSVGFTDRFEVGILSGLKNGSYRTQLYNEMMGNNFYYYQEAIIKVPKGTKGFLRIASNDALSGTGINQDTSIPIMGVLPTLNSYIPTISINQGVHSSIDYTKHELYFDTCDGDVELENVFVIQDNARIGVHIGDNGPVTALDSEYRFYVKDSLGRPIEGLKLSLSWPGINAGGMNALFWDVFTDHNGFASISPSEYTITDTPVINIWGETSCNNLEIIHSQTILMHWGETTQIDITVSNVNYASDHYADVNVSIVDCNDVPLAGLKASISGSKSKISDQNGIVTFKLRNYVNKPRQFKVVIPNSNACISKGCNGQCNPCIPSIDGVLPTCLTPIKTLNIGSIKINTSTIQQRRGLKSGGQYPFAIVVKGNCGRVSAAYEVKTLSIPRLTETQTYNFCTFKYNGGNIRFPAWANCLEILRADNQNPFEIQWVIDKIERTIGNNIKITIQSLNDYNERYFFKTNTIYQWQSGDRVEFISNNGDILSSANGVLNYGTLSPFHDEQVSGKTDADINYFNQLVIPDDGRLDFIKPGAIIEIQRPKKVSSDLIPYREICVSIPILQVDNGDGTTHGELEYPIGTFETFDTYFVQRVIGGEVGLFEHHSPSDFISGHLSDLGKVHFANKYENEKRYGRNMTIASPTVRNRFNNNIKVFSGKEQGDIIAVRISDASIIKAICEKDVFLSRTGTDLLRVDPTGTVRALSADEIASDPQPNPVGEYGCSYEDVGSICFFDGGTTWIDSGKNSFIFHDFQQAYNMSDGEIRTYLQRKIQEMGINNAQNDIGDLDKYRFITGASEKNGNVFVTIKTLRSPGVNNQFAPFIQGNETFIFNPSAKKFLGFVSFTPESYGNLILNNGSGCDFVCFYQGVPYVHPLIATKWLEFFGQSVDWVVGISANEFPEKEKAFLAIEVQSETMFFSPKVETDKPNFLSEIPPIRPKKFDRKWNACLLGNKNTRQGLFGGEVPKGAYMKILLVRDNSAGLVYNSIDINKRLIYSELDQIIIKFTAQEQSGFTNNV